MNIHDYLHAIKRSHGIVPEFVNPKYIVISYFCCYRSLDRERSTYNPLVWNR